MTEYFSQETKVTPNLTNSHSEHDISVLYTKEQLLSYKETLFKQGYICFPLEISQNIFAICREKKWQCLDDTFLNETKRGKPLFNLLYFFHEISSIEFIISLREAKNEWEEDGIWHDDGSRKIAFSLSLTHPEDLQKGGVLEIKEKEGARSHQIATPPFGHIIIFLTGIHGFEHKINKVEKGHRLIIAGWGS